MRCWMPCKRLRAAQADFLSQSKPIRAEVARARQQLAADLAEQFDRVHADAAQCFAAFHRIVGCRSPGLQRSGVLASDARHALDDGLARRRAMQSLQDAFTNRFIAGHDRVRLSLRELAVDFRGPDGGRLPALGPISFEVATEEFVCVVGPSGCGKSTLIRALAGLQPRLQAKPCAKAKSLTGRCSPSPSCSRTRT